MIDRKKVRAAVDYYENEGYGNHIGILIELAEAYLNKELIEPMNESDVFTIIVRHTIENGWYPSSDNKCMDLAQSLVGKVGKWEDK